MTDLHSHILPHLDDGAADPAAAVKLLEMEMLQGIDNIALTSHYNHDKMSIDTFLKRRELSFRILKASMTPEMEKLNLKLGSEVMFFPHLISEPIDRLCLEGTDVLLLELPLDHNPTFMQETLDYLVADGIIPVIAHVERYRYLLSDPRILADWVDMGAYAQINGSTLLHSDEQSAMAMKFIKWNLVHAIASDTHSVDKRPPVVRQALREVERQLGKRKAAWLEQNADALFAGTEPDYRTPHIPKHILGRWL